jgi:hypothetical protein
MSEVADDEVFERTLCQLSQCHVFKIPVRKTAGTFLFPYSSNCSIRNLEVTVVEVATQTINRNAIYLITASICSHYYDSFLQDFLIITFI